MILGCGWHEFVGGMGVYVFVVFVGGAGGWVVLCPHFAGKIKL